MTEDPRCGWNSKFPHFRSTPSRFIRESLNAYIKDAGPAQVRAWDDTYRVLLTRSRDGTVVFIPPLPELNETRKYLTASGFRRLD